MATRSSVTYKERDLMRQQTVTVRIERGSFHPFLLRFGLWMVRCGFRITGAGRVDIIDGREAD